MSKAKGEGQKAQKAGSFAFCLLPFVLSLYFNYE